jgi:hypothetical protein
MVAFFSTLLRLFFHVFRSKRTIFSEIALLKKENEILLRRVGKKRVHSTYTIRSGEQQRIPKPGESEKTGGAVRKSAVLGGLHHHYYRRAA